MNIKTTKLFLEAYGLLRMVVGVAEIIGLASAFFFLEFIINYPPQVMMYVVDEEVVIFIYLAVLFRGAFHLMAGIGIARLRLWGMMWLSWGWPIMLLITYGVVYSYYEDWSKAGYISGFFDVFNFGKLLLYLCWIGFDLFFVNPMIEKFNNDPAFIAEGSERMEGKKILSFFFVAVFVFCILIFVGRPMKQGFHPGFYKSKGQRAESGEKKDVVTKIKSQKEIVPQKPAQEEGEKKELIVMPQKVETQEMKIDEKKPTQEPPRTIVKPEVKPQEQGLKYRLMIGLAAGVCIIMGLLFQIFELQEKGISGASFVLLGFGFFLFMVYGISTQTLPVSLTGFCAGILSFLIVFLLAKDGS